MKTVKFILVVLFAFVNINAIGQSVFVKGGLSFARVSYTNNELNDDLNGRKPKLGGHLGVAYEKKLSDAFFIEFAPMIHWKGVTEVKGVFYGDGLDMIYLDIPILLKGYFELNDNILIYNAFGPYVGFGLKGWKSDRNLIWGNDSDADFERSDFGFSLGVGLSFKRMQLGFAYDHSLLNINTSQGWYKYKHRVARVSLSYQLRKKERGKG